MTEELKIIGSPKEKLLAYLFLAKNTWISLLVGYLLVFFSIYFNFRVSASGSLLVCSALLGELLYFRNQWREWAPYLGPFSIYSPFPEEDIKRSDGTEFLTNKDGLGMHLPFQYTKHLRNISSYHKVHNRFTPNLSKEDALIGRGNLIDGWSLYGSSRRMDTITSGALIFSGVIGTILWGYGDLIFPKLC